METNRNQDQVQAAGAEPDVTNEGYDGVVIGILLGFHQDDGAPLVAFAGNPEETALKARATTRLGDTDLGHEVALMFEGGDPRLPLVIGVVQHPEDRKTQDPAPFTANLDGEQIQLRARQKIVIKCGLASITLTPAGKIVIRGTYLLSHSSGVNRIKGGSIQAN